jgi:hypothetical protein
MQLTYSSSLVAGALGTVCAHERSLAVVNLTGATIEDGRFLAYDSTGDNFARLPTGSGDKLIGVNSIVSTNVNGFANNTVGSALVKGNVYVYTNDAVTPADPVYVQYTVNSTRALGTVGKTDDTSKAVLVAGARFMASASAGSIVEIAVNLA